MDQSENQNAMKFVVENRKYNSLDDDRERNTMAQGSQGSQS